MSESGSVKDRIADVRTKLEKVTAMVGDLSKKTDSSEPLGDLVERELAQMDKAIEEAGAKIAVSASFI
jgi:pyruvate carboxylase